MGRSWGLSTLDKKGPYRLIALQWLLGVDRDLGGHGGLMNTIGADLLPVPFGALLRCVFLADSDTGRQ